jgi:hypothetical protein
MSGRHAMHQRAAADLADRVREIADHYHLSCPELVLVLSEITTNHARRLADEATDSTRIIPAVRGRW